MIVLVSGSRNATQTDHGATIAAALAAAVAGRPGPHMLVHGDAPGVDTIAANVAQCDSGWTMKAIPTDWESPCQAECRAGHRRHNRRGRLYCPNAGHRRNQQLVDFAATHLPNAVGLFFPMPDSRGTWDCRRRAERVGLPVQDHPLEPATPHA